MSLVPRGVSVDELLGRAVAAINRGDRAAATVLAGQVLAVDCDNVDATDLLANLGDGGEIHRLTILFADLVDSALLSTRAEPESYRLLESRYRDLVLGVVDRFKGHVGSTKGDGLLAVFGHPQAREDDVRRAVLAGLEITREVARLSEQAKRRFGIEVAVRVGVHRGLVYVDTGQDYVYGSAANLAARMSGLAPPGAVVVSATVEPLIRGAFDLEVRPSAASKSVEGMVAHHQVVGVRAVLARVGRGTLVGRDAELARLEKSWARAQAGTLSTPGVVFRGEPGIGKSRLAAAAAELVERSGGMVLELFGSRFHTDAGLHPVRILLERRCGIDRGTDQRARLRLLKAEIAARSLNPATMVPLLAPVLGIEAGYDPMPAAGRKLYEMIAEAVQTYLVACLGDGAGLVVAENVPWFDLSTMEVLGSLLGAGQGRLLVVITGRSGGRLPPGWPVEVFDLTPLSDEQADALITALNPCMLAEERALVVERYGGVPFYIEQVAGLNQTGVPGARYEPLFARLRASANVMAVLEAAAVIGHQMDRRLLCSVVDLSDDDVDDVIDELENALVLEPRGTDRWRFRHELQREVAAELAPPTVRRGLHAKVADALVGSAGAEADWRLVAGHYERAERFDQAATAYQHASTDARRRGALSEARSYLTQALAQLDRAIPGPDRNRHEVFLRSRRGLLTSAVEGYQSRDAAADFERCMQLVGTDLRDDELFATLAAVASYYFARADLRRTGQMLESLRVGLGEGRQWFRPAIEALSGAVAWLRGDVDAAVFCLEAATTGQPPAGHHDVDAVWFPPNEPIAHVHLALAHVVRGDLIGAEAELARAARRAAQLGFPRGPFMHAYALFVESWMCVEAGQLDRAAVLAADLIDRAARQDFDEYRLWGAAQQHTVRALAALSADDPDPTALSAHIATMTSFLDNLRKFELLTYVTYFDAVLGRLLIAAGHPEQARYRLDTALALAHDTELCFYDAELLRLKAHTHTDPDARQADITAAFELAHRQGATLFELRAALDDFELRGEPARATLVDAVSRIPSNNAWPELARAKGALSEASPRI